MSRGERICAEERKRGLMADGSDAAVLHRAFTISCKRGEVLSPAGGGSGWVGVETQVSREQGDVGV